MENNPIESEKLKGEGVPIHGGKYVQYNVLGNIFEVYAKYAPPLQPVGRGAYGIVWLLSYSSYFSYFPFQLNFDLFSQFQLTNLLFICVFSCATNSETKEGVAIKKIGNAFDNRIDAKRTLREIKLLSHMDHDNVRDYLLIYLFMIIVDFTYFPISLDF